MHKYHLPLLFIIMCKILPVYYYASCAFEDKQVWFVKNITMKKMKL